MAAVRQRRRRTAAVPWLPIAAVVAAGLGVLSVAWAVGLFGGAGAPGPAAPPPGTVGVPAAGTRIPAYAQIELEHLLDPRTGALAAVVLPEDSILEGTITDPKQLLGRVLAQEKPAGRLFHESDFLPDGTRPGLVAGIPPGKRAMRIDATAVHGLVGLGAGDRFDLIASFQPGRGAARRLRTSAIRGSGAVDPSGQTDVQIVVEDGVVVQPLAARAVPGARDARVVQELVVAVTPEEVPRLTEALAIGARIDCVPRSGRPENGPANAAAPPPRRPGVHVVDRIDGGRRELVAVPRAETEAATP